MRCSIALLLVSASWNAGGAQSPRVRVSCDSCRIALEAAGQLPYVWRDGGFVSRPSAVVPVGKQFWVLDVDDRSYRFDEAGRHLGPIGRQGRGPGEFSRIGHLLKTSAASIFVFDNAQGRVSVMDPRGEFTRSFMWPGRAPYYTTVLPSGEIIANLAIPTRSSYGLPLHRFSSSGTLKLSFGRTNDEAQADPRWVPHATIFRESPSDTIHALPFGQGALHAFDAGGKLLWRWDLPVDLDFVRRPYRSGDPERITVQGMDAWWDEGRDFAWLALWYPDPNPTGALSSRAVPIPNHPSEYISSYSRFVNTLLLAIDVRRRTVLAATSLDGALVRTSGRGRHIWLLERSRDGDSLRHYVVNLQR